MGAMHVVRLACYYSPSMFLRIPIGRLVPVLLAVCALWPATAKAGGNADGHMPGILTPPAIDGDVLYFVCQPGTIFAFDEESNAVRWSARLDPPPDAFDPEALPAPPPTPLGSYVLVHLGRRLWGVSKVDGRSVWHVDGLPEASYRAAVRSSNTMPGYYAFDMETEGIVLTIEQEGEEWFTRNRRLGDGGVSWERRLDGEPRAWWADRDCLCVACESRGTGGSSSSEGSRCSIARLDVGTGEIVWDAPFPEDGWFRASFRASYQTVRLIYMLRELPLHKFEVTALREESGETFRTISYESGDFLKALASGDKLVFLHREGSEEQRQVRFLLYYSSLNPIRFQTIREARSDQLFPAPEVDRNLFLYGGRVYSLYDGRLVWQQDTQRWLVGWAADDYFLYIWDSSGFLFSLDRLTGQEKWSTPFNVLPPEESLGPNYSGASMILAGGRLFVATPKAELWRVDPASGEPYPGILRISMTDGGREVVAARTGQPSPGRRFPWVWLSIAILALIGISFLWFGSRTSASQGRM